MEKVICSKDLKKSYGELIAVDLLNISVERGEIFGLLGSNGSGKSTTIECILGTKKMDSGEVSILGMNPSLERKNLFQRVGVQFQEAKYPEKILISELCEETQSLYKNPIDYKELLIKFGLESKKKRPISELSGGQKQKLFIILALIANPEVLFFDELTTGLDPKSRREVWKYLLELKEKRMTLLLTSHFMDEVEALCDKIAILKRGKIVFSGTVKEAVDSGNFHNLEDAYLWYAEEEDHHEDI